MCIRDRYQRRVRGRRVCRDAPSLLGMSGRLTMLARGRCCYWRLCSSGFQEVTLQGSTDSAGQHSSDTEMRDADTTQDDTPPIRTSSDVCGRALKRARLSQ
eukprot:TRINITY_DN4727_c0_g1_i2.p1 TRINITY_DN4727_c0_g1~~TRINITY_DN4727_c0_g1_i2.p1  ORF type:complete len:101 (-),score=20.05 TRINITY_DN4727_c0_g1_i2:412-714(-)